MDLETIKAYVKKTCYYPLVILAEEEALVVA